MKIVVLGNFGISWDGSICDEEHIAHALEDKGHEVLRIQRERTQEKEFREWKSPEYDFVLISQWANYPPELVEICKNYTYGPIVYWAFDYQWSGQEAWHLELARQADVFLSKEMEHRAKYEEIGANFRWLPQDFAPTFLDRDFSKPVEKDIDVLFTGSALSQCPDRTALLQEIDKRFNLVVYSVTDDAWRTNGLKDVRGAVMDEALNDLIPRAKVNISIDLWHSEGYWSDRNAQIMSCGGLVLFRYVPLSETVFHDAVQYFYDIEDCLMKLEVLLANNNEMAERYAWMYAKNNLTVDNRVADMLTIVKEYV